MELNEYEVGKAINRYKKVNYGTPPKYLIVSEKVYWEIKMELPFIPSCVKHNPRDGDTYMELKVAVRFHTDDDDWEVSR